MRMPVGQTPRPIEALKVGDRLYGQGTVLSTTKRACRDLIRFCRCLPAYATAAAKPYVIECSPRQPISTSQGLVCAADFLSHRAAIQYVVVWLGPLTTKPAGTWPTSHQRMSLVATL